jgi:hypothetical protein
MRFLATLLALGSAFVFNAMAQSGSIIATKHPSPDYPESVKNLKMGGIVVVELQVLPNGSVSSVRLKSARLNRPYDQSPSDSDSVVRELSDSALSAARLWNFENTGGWSHSAEIMFKFQSGRVTSHMLRVARARTEREW